MRLRSLASLSLLATMGCGNLLGLDDYSNAPPAGSGGAGATGAGGPTSQGGATASTGSSVGGTGGSGGSGGGPVDPCDNHVLDPGEEGVDCGGECPACPTEPCPGSHVCVPPPGGGWSEPVAIASESVGCGAEFPRAVGAVIRDGLSAAAATCGCTCGAPNVACADMVQVVQYPVVNCANNPGNVTTASPNSCVPKSGGSTTSQGFQLAPPTASCAAGQVDETIPPATWSTSLVACGGVQQAGFCENAADTCVPTPTAPFQAGICVAQVGNHTCPAAFPDKTVYFAGIDDDRDCPASCSCTASGSSCQSIVFQFAPSSACFGDNEPLTLSSGAQVCAITGGITSALADDITKVSDGVCAPGTATPSGSASPSDPVTICCM